MTVTTGREQHRTRLEAVVTKPNDIGEQARQRSRR